MEIEPFSIDNWIFLYLIAPLDYCRLLLFIANVFEYRINNTNLDNYYLGHLISDKIFFTVILINIINNYNGNINRDIKNYLFILFFKMIIYINY